MATQVSDDVIYSTAEAALYLGLSAATVRVYVQREIIKAEPIGPINVIRQSECDRYKRERNPRGNPAFQQTKQQKKKTKK